MILPQTVKEAGDRLYGSTPTDSDGVVALRLAAFLLARWKPGEPVQLGTFDTCGLATLPGEYHEQAFTFSTDDLETATGWIVQATLAGSCVFLTSHGTTPGSYIGFQTGSIKKVRQHISESRSQEVTGLKSDRRA